MDKKAIDRTQFKIMVDKQVITDIENCCYSISENNHGKILVEFYDCFSNVTLRKESELTLYIEDNIIFCGIINKIIIKEEYGQKRFSVHAITASFKMDQIKRNRSFQDVRDTFSDVMDQVMKLYDGYHISTINDSIKIKKPIFQYEETDWNFLKRISSMIGQGIYADCQSTKYRFSLGVPRSNYDVSFCEKIELEYDNLYHCDSVNIITNSIITIGSIYQIKNVTYCVNSMACELLGGVLVFQAKLYPIEKQSKRIFNNRLVGVSLSGKTMDRFGDRLKVYLDIDKPYQKPNKDKEYPFVFSPDTASLLYAMPELDQSVMLKIHDHFETATVVHVLRGGSNRQLYPIKKQFRTKEGNYFKADGNEITFNIKDNYCSLHFIEYKGFSIFSNERLDISAEKIKIKSSEFVTFVAHDSIHFLATKLMSGLKIDANIDIKAVGDIIQTSTKTDKRTIVKTTNVDIGTMKKHMACINVLATASMPPIGVSCSAVVGMLPLVSIALSTIPKSVSREQSISAARKILKGAQLDYTPKKTIK